MFLNTVKKHEDLDASNYRMVIAQKGRTTGLTSPSSVWKQTEVQVVGKSKPTEDH
ncbi:hypothetical protein AAFF_G00083900 [Aldrovandia affinis]|uniref:Uncharacterized protein n=1 Tax=Aldrovandia affinis TaxID=143900 RepID=A0AAD7WDG8_9TELE|nr:hypothetical protein AAFF_G00083900 [Aldrovandia affinis]